MFDFFQKLSKHEGAKHVAKGLGTRLARPAAVLIGALAAAWVGAALYWITPFKAGQALAMAARPWLPRRTWMAPIPS